MVDSLRDFASGTTNANDGDTDSANTAKDTVSLFHSGEGCKNDARLVLEEMSGRWFMAELGKCLLTLVFVERIC